MEGTKVLNPEYDDVTNLDFLIKENSELKEEIQKIYNSSCTMYKLLESYESTLVIIQKTIDLVRNNVRLIKEKGNI